MIRTQHGRRADKKVRFGTERLEEKVLMAVVGGQAGAQAAAFATEGDLIFLDTLLADLGLIGNPNISDDVTPAQIAAFESFLNGTPQGRVNATRAVFNNSLATRNAVFQTFALNLGPAFPLPDGTTFEEFFNANPALLAGAVQNLSMGRTSLEKLAVEVYASPLFLELYGITTKAEYINTVYTLATGFATPGLAGPISRQNFNFLSRNLKLGSETSRFHIANTIVNSQPALISTIFYFYNIAFPRFDIDGNVIQPTARDIKQGIHLLRSGGFRALALSIVISPSYAPYI